MVKKYKNFLSRFQFLNGRDLKYIWCKADQDMIFVHAASLAYSTFLNFIPLVALAYYFFDFIGGFEQLQGQLQTFINENLEPQFAEDILTYLEIIRIKINPKTMGVFGVLGFIISGIFLLSKVEFSLNSMWNIPKTRPWSQKITTYWTMLSLGPIFIGFSAVVLRAAFNLLEDDDGGWGWLIAGIVSLLPYITGTFLFTAIFLWLPAVRISWKPAMVGGIVSAILFEILKQTYAFYAVYSLKNSVYGTLAVIPVFLIWIYLLWVVILFGAQVCQFVIEGKNKKTVESEV